MKELLTQMASYNTWANGLLVESLNTLPEATHTTPVPSSFKTLKATLVHMWNAESIWWQRMKLLEKITVPGESFEGTFGEAAIQLLKQNRQWQEWVAAAGIHMLEHEFIYQNSKKEQFKQPVYQVLQQIFNHGTYHRGQMIVMMHQLGLQKMPQTDFIVWSRKGKS